MGSDVVRNFFSRSLEFSFKDLLAVVFTGFFLYYCNKALASEAAMDLVRTLVPLIVIILGGYFGQEAFELWRRNRGSCSCLGKGESNHADYSDRPPI